MYGNISGTDRMESFSDSSEPDDEFVGDRDA